MPVSLSVTLFCNSVVLEAIIAHKSDTNEMYDFKVDQKLGTLPPLYHSSNLVRIALVVAGIQGVR